MQKEEQDLRDRTKAFALRIISMFSAIPKTTEAQVPGKQLLRSGTSIGANYRETFRARSKAAFIAKCGDSLREIKESAARSPNRVAGFPRLVRSSQPPAVKFAPANRWLELLVESRIGARKTLSFAAGVRTADRHFRYDLEAGEDFLIGHLRS